MSDLCFTYNSSQLCCLKVLVVFFNCCIRHPNLLRCFEAFVVPNISTGQVAFYLSMEYCPGGSLREQIEQNSQAFSEVLVQTLCVYVYVCICECILLRFKKYLAKDMSFKTEIGFCILA